MNLRPSPDNKVHVANNGIFNSQEEAAKNAVQNSTAGAGPQYFIYFPKANNTVSELVIAGYQNFLEGKNIGLTNAAVENNQLLERYGVDGLSLDGHSRGSLTVRNSLESLIDAPDANGMASGTHVQFYGPAANAFGTDRTLGALQNRQNMTDQQQEAAVLQYQNNIADPIGILIGGNPATGGAISPGSDVSSEMLRAISGEAFTTHNGYGAGAEKCRAFWGGTTTSLPALVPATPDGSKK